MRRRETENEETFGLERCKTTKLLEVVAYNKTEISKGLLIFFILENDDVT